MDNSVIWKLIDSHFKENPQSLVTHHIESYNDFFQNGIFQIFKEKNPIQINSRFDTEINEFRSQCSMYLGGKDGSKIYFGKPVIYDQNNAHYMFPNEARLRNMTYGMTIHYDIEVEIKTILKPGETHMIIGEDGLPTIQEEEEEETVNFDLKNGGHNEGDNLDNRDVDITEGGVGPKMPPRKKKQLKVAARTPSETAKLRETTERSIQQNIQTQTFTLEQVYLGKFPIMLQSQYCILNGMSRDIRFSAGECRNDIGGYFIIGGKEKTVVSQEKFADNILYIRKSSDDKYLYSAEIRSVSENVSKPIRTLSVKLVAPTNKYTFKNIVVNIPNVRTPIPLFIVFRALGVLSDKSIISMCLLDTEKYESMEDLFIPSVHDAGAIMSQITALKFIATFTKGKTVVHALEILSDYFFPHIGEINYLQKAYYLGHVVFRLLSVYTGLEEPTNRDNFKFKRIELVGTLLYDLFREYYTIQQREIQLEFESRLFYNQALYSNNLSGLIQENYKEILQENGRAVDAGFHKAFKGGWGAKPHTQRVGIVQDLNRLSHNAMLSHLRKTTLPLDAGLKLVGPRLLHSSQWGIFDPIDTPDGGNIGLHKHLSIMAYVSQGVSREPTIRWLRENTDMKLLEECFPKELGTMTKIFINGYWAGSTNQPREIQEKLKLYRRNALIPIYMSISFDIKQNMLILYTDGGRLCRPIFYRDEISGKMSYDNANTMLAIESGKFTWMDLITGFNAKKVPGFNPSQMKLYELNELYEGIESEKNPAKITRFINDKAIIDYVDTSESENALIALNQDILENEKNKNYTHLEIHESLVLGMMCNLINFPENNPAVRNSFSCGQSKQAVSLYHTNYQLRMDKASVVLSYGQVPLVKTRYLEHINHEENPYGENAIVAIMCYTGYNVEDAILVNEGALKRGLFRTTYYTTYETHEENSRVGDVSQKKVFINIESDAEVVGTKPGYDYSKLDKYGLIRENTPIDEKTVMIGLASSDGSGRKVDASKTPKKGQVGLVDKTFITEGEEGHRIAKVRVREERIPAIGDKMASRAGQKGTIGLVIPECDMPFTKNGIRPDLIINPHAIPSRMTIGQFVECIMGKAAAIYGGFGDCTAFNNHGSKAGVFGKMLSDSGFHSSGNELLYNGMTGEQIESNIFIGPTYYMRLKHMVKDKINFRAQGPRTALTKQPVSGRANDGGLRIGEMERDSIISHGAGDFLRESMMERGDKYYVAVCNKTGMVAIYNPSNHLLISPMADGPVQYVGAAISGEDKNVQQITRFGRSFSIVCIPYSLKLFIQELQTMNIQMRVITEDNIQQLDSLTYSNNIEKLTHIKDMNPTGIISIIKKTLAETKKPVLPVIYEPTVGIVPTSPDFPPPGPLTPEYPSPEYPSPSTSPQFNPKAEYPASGSPQFNPRGEYVPGTPEYAPGSPGYAPGTPASSPGYAPGSPASSPGYAPGSPASSPAYAPGSPASEESQFEVGEPVLMRGGGAEPWTIKKIGDRFITVINDKMDDPIRVVEPMEIYRPDASYFRNPQIQQPSYHNEMYGNDLYSNMRNPQEETPSQINFAPVIKIVNGNDMSNDGYVADSSVPNTYDSRNMLGGGGKTMGGNGVIGSGTGVSGTGVSGSTESAASAPKSKSTASDVGSGIIDFAKSFFIKKIE